MSDFRHGGDLYHHPNVTDFSANINYFGMPEAVRRAAAAGVHSAEHYPDPACRNLRDSLAGWENRDGASGSITPEHIVCGNGASELIYAAVRAEQPKRALLTAPGFSEYERALDSTGCEISFYMLRRGSGFVLEEDFLERLDAGVDMVFLCSPNNPTGLLTEPELLQRIVEKCRERNILLVVDECFLEFTGEIEKYSAKRFLDGNPHLFILKAFTKLFAVPGLRLGYGLCGDREFLEKVKKQLPAWNVSYPAQTAGIAACGEAAFVKESVAAAAKERERIKKRLAEMGFAVTDSRADFLFFSAAEDGEEPADRAGAFGEKAGPLFDHCLRRGYYIRDCSNFRGLRKGDYRIAVRKPEENEKLLHVIQDWKKIWQK